MDARIKADLDDKGVPDELQANIYAAVLGNESLSVQSYIVLFAHYVYVTKEVSHPGTEEKPQDWIKERLRREWFSLH